MKRGATWVVFSDKVAIRKTKATTRMNIGVARIDISKEQCRFSIFKFFG